LIESGSFIVHFQLNDYPDTISQPFDLYVPEPEAKLRFTKVTDKFIIERGVSSTFEIVLQSTN
jgi:hypothetical protein